MRSCCNYKLTAHVSANGSSLAARTTHQGGSIPITALATPIRDAMPQCGAHDNPEKGGVITVRTGL